MQPYQEQYMSLSMLVAEVVFADAVAEVVAAAVLG